MLDALALLALVLPGPDWPVWRGSDHDGVSRERAFAPEGRPLWSRHVGLGHSSASVRDGLLVTLGFDLASERDVVLCLDAADGRELWSAAYPAALRDQDHSGGTLTSAAIGPELVWVASREGALRCFARADGKLVWSHDFAAELGAEPGPYGFSGSPVLLGELVIASADRTLALDAATGALRWRTEPMLAQYSTPTPFTVGGETRLAVFAEDALRVLDPADGSALWSFPWRTPERGLNASSPVAVGERIFVSSAYERGCALVSFDGGEARAVWQNRAMRNKMAGCVLVNDLIFGFDESMLKCVDLDGEERWRKRGLGDGALSAAGDRLLLTTSRGELVIAAADGAAYRELSRAKVFDDGTFWSPPVLADGRIYLRSSLGEVVCRDHRTVPDEPARAAAAAPAERTPTDAPEAAALFQRHLEAIGGAELLRSRTTRHETGTFEMRAVGFPPVEFEIHRRAPSAWRARIKLPGGREGSMVRVWDGEIAFEINPYRGDRLYDDALQSEYRNTAPLFAEAEWRALYRDVRTTGAADFQDRPCWRVDATTADGARRTLWFSRESGLLIGYEGERDSMALFDAWREFDGLLVPTERTYWVQDTGVAEQWHVEAVDFGEVDPALFERSERVRALLEERASDSGER